MIAFLVMALVAYMAAGNKDRRTASGQAVRAARSTGGTAARNTWTKRRPDRSASKKRINSWWGKTPVRRTVRTGGRAVRTTGQFGLAGLLAGLSALWAGGRTAAGEWRTTHRGQREQSRPDRVVATDEDPLLPWRKPDLPASDNTPDSPSDRTPDNPWGDPQPIRLVSGRGGGQVERFCLEVHLGGSESPTSSGGYASRLPRAEAIAAAEQWARSTIMSQLRRDDVGVLYRTTEGVSEQVGSYRGHRPLPGDTGTDETTTHNTHAAKEAAMSTAPADIGDLTTHIKELEDFYQELSEGEIWPIIEAWAAGSDLLSRDLGSDTHSATDEVASAAQAMLDGREVILDAVEYAIQEAKATVGDAA